MKIEQIIINSLEVSKLTNIPVLFFSNPGLGKTTILKRYAEHKNYHLETLIGSRFTPEEISGFMVNNGGENLQHMNPEWFSRIIQKSSENIPTLLFIDELSTCSESVQGALLSLIFDRSIGNGKKLPDDCLIVSAANYSKNLSSYMNILPPTLNRFMIINLNEFYTAIDMLDEFLETPSNIQYPEVCNTLDKAENEFYDSIFKEFWRNTFFKYSDPESALGILDIKNNNLENLYQNSDSSVYNFISGRTLSYLSKSFKAYISLNLNDVTFFKLMTGGLVGAGTLSFKDEKQAEKYRTYVHTHLIKLTKVQKKIKQALPVLTGDVSKDIATFITCKEDLSLNIEDEFTIVSELFDEIKKRFEIKNVLESSKELEGIARFVSDYEATLEFQQLITGYQDTKFILNEISTITFDYYGLYCDILNKKPDFEETFGVKNSLFEKVCFLKFEEENQKPIYKKACLRFADTHEKPCLYLMEDSQNYLEANLKTPIVTSSAHFRALIYKDGFKFRLIDKYLESTKKIA